MEFDLKKFETTNFKDRVEGVTLSNLKAFFKKKKGEKKDGGPIWKVRGLTGEESAIAKQAVANNKNMDAILSAMGSALKADKIEGIKELAGISDSTPDDLVQRFSWLEHGSVDPICDHNIAMKLAQNFPVEFYLLTNKIMELTGRGRLGE